MLVTHYFFPEMMFAMDVEMESILHEKTRFCQAMEFFNHQ